MKTKRIKKTSAPPHGYEKIEPTLKKLRDRLVKAQTESSTKTASQSLWPITKISFQINRYIYDMYYKRKLISKDLYDWLMLQSYANPELIAKWKKQGYENLCCIQCIRADSNHKNTCICRVPKATLLKNESEEVATSVECVTCGCKGCGSAD